MIKELLEALKSADKEDGQTIFNHTPEELGLYVMECSDDLIHQLEQAEACRTELNKIAEQVGEEGDPFAAWETIGLIQRQLAIYSDAVQRIIRCPSGSRAVAICHEANSRAAPV